MVEGAFDLKIANLDILAAPHDYDYKMRLTIRDHFPKREDSIIVDLNQDELERLITYLKGVRDGIGWNHKAQGDRNL